MIINFWRKLMEFKCRVCHQLKIVCYSWSASLLGMWTQPLPGHLSNFNKKVLNYAQKERKIGCDGSVRHWHVTHLPFDENRLWVDQPSFNTLLANNDALFNAFWRALCDSFPHDSHHSTCKNVPDILPERIIMAGNKAFSKFTIVHHLSF